MRGSAPESTIVLLGAPPMPGELIASYLRHRLPNVAVKLCATCADLKGGAARGFVLIEMSARSAQNIGETVARVRSDHPQAPILIAAASAKPGSAAAAMRCGAQGFVPRLTPLSGLADALQTLLAGQTCFPRLAPVDERSGDGEGDRRPTPTPTPPGGTDDGFPSPSVELEIIRSEFARTGEDAYDAYFGPCRRRGATTNWNGPERRRTAAQ